MILNKLLSSSGFTFKSALTGVALAVSSYTLLAQSEDDMNGDSFDSDILLLDTFIVTGTAGETTKQKSSISITTLDMGKLETTVPRTASETFRTIPGIKVESSAGDGNTNIAVRGIPISAGGAKYLQIHEDGLPILEYGDIAFAPADGFYRPDYSMEVIEAVRGGSASIFASNSPGGIINILSRTGIQDGGELGVTYGLDYDETRLDFRYGGAISDDMRFHLGGFYRIGEGVRDTGYTANNGGQIKLNITRSFDRGYVRLYFKQLDDRTATYLPMPIKVSGSSSDPTIGGLAAFDEKDDTPHSQYFTTNLGTDGEGNRRVSDIEDGLRSLETSIGLEANLKLGDGWSLVNRMRLSARSGRFLSPFPAEVGEAQSIADSIAGEGATLAYANGPFAGQVIEAARLNGNGMLMRTHLFDTELNDLGNFVNDMRLMKSFDFADDSSVDLTAGYYKSRQSIDMDWLWNSYLLEVKGQDAALVDVFDAEGNARSENGLYAYGVPAWGALHRSYDTSYDTDALYASAKYEKGNLSVDAGIRLDKGTASGSYSGTVFRENFDINQDGMISAPEETVAVVDNANRKPVDYNYDYWSYSAGANYLINKDLAVFGRYSKGGRANADRLLFGPSILADGSIIDEAAAVDETKQLEAGVKYRTDSLLPGNLAVFATVFNATTEESNFEATTQKFVDRVYEATGLEIEAAYQLGGFDLKVGLTYTDAKIAKDRLNPAMEGNTPRRQADWVYSIAPSYTMEKWYFGASLIGTTKSYAQDNNDLVMPGYNYLNLTTSYQITEGLDVTLSVNNVSDEFGLTESEEGSIPANGIIRARGIAGRTASISMRYRF
jgi:outer membrane receptor protein involved in Fe transport